jgi:membrane protein
MMAATDRDEQATRGDAGFATASTGELVGRLAEEGKELVKKEIELAKAELRTEWKDEVRMALGLAASAVAAFLTLELLFAALVLALAGAMPGWAAALVAAGVALVLSTTAAVVGWQMRAKSLLGKTRKTLKEDAQ